jgi:cell division protein FtsQ
LSLIQLKHIFFGTSYFELKKIEVTGNSYLTKESVLKIAGIAPGLNVLLIDRDGIKRRLLLNSFIKTAEVKLEGLYNLRLVVEERKPFLYAKVGASFLEIASDGVVMSIKSSPDFNFPIITGLNLETSRPGDSLLDNDGFFTARKWINFLGSEILSQLSEINLFSLQNPYVYLLTGEKVFPRSLEDFKKRYLFLRALLDNLRKNNVEPIYLDMRAPSEIVVRPKNKK